MQWFRQPWEPLLSVVMREASAVFEHDVAPLCSNRIFSLLRRTVNEAPE